MANTECFWPDGSYASSFVTCGAKNFTSHCCVEHDYCLANRLCFSQRDSILYRGACTNGSWPQDSCGDKCLDVRDKPNGVLACLDDTEQWEGKFVCFGSNCSYGSTFELEPASIQMTEALAVDLALPSYKSNTVHLGLGLGFGLGLPLLAALVGCLWFWKRHRHVQKPAYQPNGTNKQEHVWPRPGSDPSNPLATSGSGNHIAKPLEEFAMPSAYTAVPELGDTSALNGSTTANADQVAQAGGSVSRLGWQMVADQVPGELDSQAKWNSDHR